MFQRLRDDLAVSGYDGMARLHPGQRLIADHPARFKLLCCGRKWGKTDFAAELLNNSLRQGRWVASLAPAYKTTRAIWEYLVPRLPKEAQVNQGTLSIKLPNGGKFTGWSLDTTAADSVRPFEYDDIVIDEAAFVPALYNKWTEILLPTLSKRRGHAYFLSTPCGFNDFFRLFQMGQDPDEELWASWKFPTVGHVYGNPHIDSAEIEMQRKLLPERSFKQEYMASFEDDAGVIYDQFSSEMDAGNVSYNAEYDANLPVVWGVDDGYVYGDGPGSASYHPRVILFGQFTPRGGLNVFDEYVQAGEVEEVSISNALAKPYPAPDVVYIDSSAAQLRARMNALGLQTIGATHKVSEGIKNVRRLICDGQGQRLLMFHPRCKTAIKEHQMYRYDIHSNGEPKPLKVDEHTCFVAGTLIETDRGSVAIEALKAGDRVLTRDGYHEIDVCGETSVSPVITVKINDAYSLTGTADHPVYTDNRGFVALRELGINDIILARERTAPQRQDRAFAPTIANLPIATRQALTTKPANALVAAKASHVTNTCPPSIAAVRVQHLNVTSDSIPQTVYNLSVNAVPEYFANGVLVHNCDTSRYICWSLRYNQ